MRSCAGRCARGCPLCSSCFMPDDIILMSVVSPIALTVWSKSRVCLLRLEVDMGSELGQKLSYCALMACIV